MAYRARVAEGSADGRGIGHLGAVDALRLVGFRSDLACRGDQQTPNEHLERWAWFDAERTRNASDARSPAGSGLSGARQTLEALGLAVERIRRACVRQQQPDTISRSTCVQPASGVGTFGAQQTLVVTVAIRNVTTGCIANAHSQPASEPKSNKAHRANVLRSQSRQKERPTDGLYLPTGQFRHSPDACNRIGERKKSNPLSGSQDKIPFGGVHLGGRERADGANQALRAQRVAEVAGLAFTAHKCTGDGIRTANEQGREADLHAGGSRQRVVDRAGRAAMIAKHSNTASGPNSESSRTSYQGKQAVDEFCVLKVPSGQGGHSTDLPSVVVPAGHTLKDT